MRAEEIFKKYRKLKEELELIVIQIETFTGIPEEDVIQMLNFSSPDWGDRVQTSNTSDKTSQIAINLQKETIKQNAEYMDFLQEHYKQVRDEIRFFEVCVKKMGSTKADVLMDLIDGGYTYEQLAQRYHLSRSTIKKYRLEAAEKINEKIRQRDSLDLEYMLS